MENGKYKGSLRLDWINKDFSLYYEIDEKEGKGVRPIWVPKNDIRVAEPRILRFERSYGEAKNENMLIKGDNLLVLRSLVETLKGKPEQDRIKCIYIDPPFNSGNAFQYYDDNLQHSEWLTMMRDRLRLLRMVLRKDGVIFVHIDFEELAYLKVLMDEIFGRDNFIAQINWQRVPEGRTLLGQGQAEITISTEYILIYAFAKKQNLLNKTIKKYTDATDRVLEQYSMVLSGISGKKLIKKFSDSSGETVEIYEYKSYKYVRLPQKIFRTDRNEYLKIFLSNFENIVQSVGVQEESTFQQKIISELKHKNVLYSASYISSKGKRKGAAIEDFFINKRKLLYAKDYARINNKRIFRETDMNDFWGSNEIPVTGTADEGGVSFKRSKKPEGLIKRIIEISTSNNDLILDVFGGSGTTAAVAHKLQRRWIMVEIGKHAEELIIPRMERIIAGKDQSGISKEINWRGGGGFKYYKLGDSVIHEKDMNWKMRVEEMAEAVFLHFQYRLEKDYIFEDKNIFLGKHRATPYHFAICFASREVLSINEEQYEKIIVHLDREKRFRHLTIFTNTPVVVSPEIIDVRVLIEKIPAKILREYNLL
jgi:adenine-specific DNA-methyltransferase